MMNWIDKIIKRSTPISALCDEEDELIEALISVAIGCKIDIPIGIKLAALYDLAIGSVYYTNITNSGWLYCDLNHPKLVLPFVNCCPEHVLKRFFFFHKSNKPTSAKIGQATTRILLLFYQKLFDKFNKNLTVLKAVEPVDAIFYNVDDKCIFLGEIKSSPLLTLSLCTPCESQTSYDLNGNITIIEHKEMDNCHIINKELFIQLPTRLDNEWHMINYSIGQKSSIDDDKFAYKGVLKLLDDKRFIEDYLIYWKVSFDAYCSKMTKENIFWLTNACGKPSDLPYDWAGGVTCISDEKTSVGMDRTDDIKKSIYQVIKLGAEGKLRKTGWNCKVGILSNIHPARHFDVYLKPIQDLIWTISQNKEIEFAKDLDPHLPMYSLFDGIVTFTDNYIRDNWLANNLDILK